MDDGADSRQYAIAREVTFWTNASRVSRRWLTACDCIAVFTTAGSALLVYYNVQSMWCLSLISAGPTLLLGIKLWRAGIWPLIHLRRLAVLSLVATQLSAAGYILGQLSLGVVIGDVVTIQLVAYLIEVAGHLIIRHSIDAETQLEIELEKGGRRGHGQASDFVPEVGVVRYRLKMGS